MTRTTAHRCTMICLLAAMVGVGLFMTPGSGQGEEARVTIDASQTAPPISKYIYGQFIEHLGRCIYGGIWAEMLVDRKFFYPVGSKESPWTVIGPEGSVTMDRNQPFVGVHSPRVTLKGDGSVVGIAHAGLGVVADKEYAGYIWLKGDPGAAPVMVRLVWGDNPGDAGETEIADVGSEYRKVTFRFRAAQSTDNARLEIVSKGNGHFYVGTVSLMPADNIHGMRADTIALLKELDSPIYRWPGGNFVSGYDWRDGIGDRDKRPPRKNPAWQGIDSNDFGIDEFMTFCRIVNTEPLVVVNTGLGDVEMALQELEYANGSVETRMGQLRASNGHREPYRVKYWGIGNEMYGNWQLGHMPLEEYVKKHNEFVAAMRKLDPTIVVIAVGNVGPWTEGMFRHCADFFDLMSEHFYVGAKKDLLEHVEQAARRVREIADAHRRYRKEILGGKAIPVALDEWNYWYGEHLYGELGTRYFLRDGLGVAKALNEYARNTDVYFMANYAQTVNVIGAIKTTKTAASFETTGLVLALYRKHFGQIPVATTCSNSVLDVQATLTEAKDALVLAVVNPTAERQHLMLQPSGVKLVAPGRAWEIAGDDPMLFNEPGKPPRVSIVEREAPHSEKVEVAPYSVTLIRFATAG
ncbi:alpha-L-arabinofuranosidase C-terminal domain-containing protein [Thermogutta sp.]|uniref:alpha-L-arabinofuranosidase C-terminal domain-containing protein n=1 Tax=Thermogutta sp. TaxID=1962930 RepID=UPI00322057B9